MEYTKEDLLVALNESIKLQAHYANLLNMYDSGQRKIFSTVESFMARLVETETIKKKESAK